MATEKRELAIEGMHCASCATIIQRSLSKVPGVSEANVNFAAQKALVTVDPKVSDEALIAAVTAKGYKARVGVDREREQKARHAEIHSLKRRLLVSAVLSVPALAISMLWMHPLQPWLLFLLATPVQFGVGWSFYRDAWSALRARTATMDTLIAVGTSAAYFYSLAHLAGLVEEQYFEIGAILITLVVLGKFLEAVAKGRTSEAIRGLLNLAPAKATAWRSGRWQSVPAAQIKVGDRLLVRPGERIPTDAVVLRGTSAVDESLITGESIPVEKSKGSKAIGGTVNAEGSLELRAQKVGSDTVLAQ
ncbi:MAG TPA: HAD-IC family P-type ATPase, partial [archaeon]|nr:HAD-IC family P-type ATPase [archaeon]